MRKQLVLISVLLLAMVLAACGDTGDSQEDSSSAQNVQPNIAGYQVESVDNIVDGFTAAIGAGALSSGNVPLAVAMERVGTSLDCLQAAGALSGQTYLQTTNVELIPQGGVSLVANTDRIARNLLNCVTEQPFGAQGLEIEPCMEVGNFTYQEENFIYMYAAAGTDICNAFRTHFRTNMGATVTAVYPPEE